MNLHFEIDNNLIDKILLDMSAKAIDEDIYYVVSNQLFTDFKYYFQQNYMKSIYLTDDLRFVIVGGSSVDFSKIPGLIYNNLHLQRIRDGWDIQLADIMYKNLRLSDILTASEYGDTSNKPRPILRPTITYFQERLTGFLSAYLLNLKGTSLIELEGGAI